MEQTFSLLCERLSLPSFYERVLFKKIAGAYFLYFQLKPGSALSPGDVQEETGRLIVQAARTITENAAYHIVPRFVRSTEQQLVYRCEIRFDSPSSVCCGRNCADCVLYK